MLESTIADSAHNIASWLKGILDPRQRQSALRQRLDQERDAAAFWIHEWMMEVPRGQLAPMAALDALAVVLTRPGDIDYELRAALYAAAKQEELEHVAFLLLEPVAEEREFDSERPLDPRGRPLTLGERKALARAPRRDLLQKLVADPHPAVVEILLLNPKLTERDVLTITSRRPIARDTLLCVVLSERFRPRHRVRRSLCLNPALPAPVAARLSATLRQKDLQDIRSDGNLPEALRDQAGRLLELRSA